jgi:DNA primase (bacterial type)
MPIPDEKVEEVRTAADLVEVAEDYVQLKQSGSRYMGLCPFHKRGYTLVQRRSGPEPLLLLRLPGRGRCL